MPSSRSCFMFRSNSSTLANGPTRTDAACDRCAAIPRGSRARCRRRAATSTRRRAFSWSANTPAWMNMGAVPGCAAAGAFDHAHRRRCAAAAAPPVWSGGSAEPARIAARREHADLHRRGAREQHVELGGGGVGQVDDAIADERPAIVDAHHDLAAIAQVRDLGVAGNGQGLVRRRHGVHVVALAQRRGCGVESRAVPRGRAALDPAVALGHHVVALAEHFVERRIAARAARLGARHGVGNRRARRAAR